MILLVSRLGLALGLTLFAAGCASSNRATAPRTSTNALTSADRGPANSRAQAALAFARSQVGKRYCWGGTGPACFDCSGLVQAAWHYAGVRLPRTSTDLARVLPEISRDEVQPGDILWWPHHVGLYEGAGEMIDAYHSGAGVVRRPAPVPARVYRVVP